MPKQLTDEELDRDMLYFLRMHCGQANAIRRWDLCIRVFGEDAAIYRGDSNTHDRQVRRSIERLRRAGHIICNLGNGDGYFMANSREEYLAFRNVYGAHAFPIMETLREMDKAAVHKGWHNPMQPTLLEG